MYWRWQDGKPGSTYSGWSGRALGLLPILLLAVVAGARSADKQGIGTDFHVFWQAGYNFAHSLPLYSPLPGARRFTYPPFAAQVFQVFGIFPLKTAAWLFYVASVGLIIVAAHLVRDIIRQLQPASRPGVVPLFLSILVSAVFILDNLAHVQVNLLILVLCLLGVRAVINSREVAAAGWLVTATAIKITPVFFLVWSMIRESRRTVVLVAAFGTLCLGLPFLQRGVAQSTTDLTAYYETFLHQFASGGVVTNFRNQNLAAMIHRAFIPSASGDVKPYDYAYLSSHAATAPLVYYVAAAVILAIFLVSPAPAKDHAPTDSSTRDLQSVPGGPPVVRDNLEGTPGHPRIRLVCVLFARSEDVTTEVELGALARVGRSLHNRARARPRREPSAPLLGRLQRVRVGNASLVRAQYHLVGIR